jgi:hypothetical protein
MERWSPRRVRIRVNREAGRFTASLSTLPSPVAYSALATLIRALTRMLVVINS